MKKILSILILITNSLTSIEWFSQSQQDQYLYRRFFSKYKTGFFVELGAYDGISISNTYAYEKYFNWKGVCIEPMPEPFALLKNNRKALCLNMCISDKSEQKTFYRIHVDEKFKQQDKHASHTEMLSGILDEYDSRHKRKISNWANKYNATIEYLPMSTSPLQEIFNTHFIQHVDFLSLDTEGNELKILKGIDLNQTTISVIAVENNYNDPNIRTYLKCFGYKFDKRLGADEIYYNPKVLEDQQKLRESEPINPPIKQET